MRSARPLGVILATLTTALLLAPSAAARPPFRLPGYVTDNAGALSGSGRGAVESAVNRLYADRHVRLWVVYVDDFSGQGAVNWTQSTRRASDLGDSDPLLAVATVDRAYAFLVPPRVRSVSSRQVDDLRRNQIEPALRRGDWSGAAVAAANGLNRAPGAPQWIALVIGLGIIAVAVVVLLLVMRYRRRRRRAAELAAARRVDLTDADALASVSLHALDDAIPETPAQRRELLTRVIVSAARADRELEAQREAFEQLRDLVINAPSRLDGLTQQFVELTARIAPSERRLAALYDEFDTAALASVSGNVATAKERLAFADQNISRARDLAARPVSGQQASLVDAVRAAESSLGQARALLDAVDSASADIRHAVATLPELITDIQTGIEQANMYLFNGQPAQGTHTRELAAARDAAAKAVDTARGSGSADPLGAFTRLTKADADLDRLLTVFAEEQATAERLNRTLEQALFTAQSRVRAVSDYIDTRRGSIGSAARTRLAEARRQLQAAQDKRSTDASEAIAGANSAATLAARAQSLANADVQFTRRAYAARYGGGNDIDAMLGGIIIGNILSGGTRGGFGGGWSPTSYGGSSGSDGGFMGGGRF